MRILSYLLIILLISGSCTNENSATEVDTVNYTEIDLKYAEYFKLKKGKDDFLLQLLDPDTKAVEQTITISKKKNPRIICLTATLTGMFCELNQRDYLIGVTAENQLYDRKLKRKFQKGQLKEYGDFAQLSLERVVNAQPNVILYNYVNTDFPHKEKLEKLGVKMVIVNDWLEAHPLAKAEWIKVIGAMTGRFDEACNLFAVIEDNYNKTAAAFSDLENKPTVISGNLIGGNWYAPSGENYFGILMKDAGGDYRYKDSKGAKSLALPLETILEDNKHTSIWLNPGVSKWNQLLQLNPHAELLNPAKNGAVFCYSGNTNKFWEQSALRADCMLEDLAHIFHPEIDSNYSFHYYAQLKK
ncbi:MAG: ABC transporter substrate-binding protein [bacterium]|nr:ABC transporter substrate-binding protein [bacterium]